MLDAWFEKPKPAPAPVTRSTAAQAEVDRETADLALYHYDSCGFCARVRRAIAALALDIELRDILRQREHRDELLAHGGRTTVPCLRIGKSDPATDRWLYESAEIVRYLTERFGADG